ncbi:MAG: hypothetical protein EXR36_01955 [Betaproteobacteria bacterium]|nr:hypothetical protein [Betaproteobacteria bacterium]
MSKLSKRRTNGRAPVWLSSIALIVTPLAALAATNFSPLAEVERKGLQVDAGTPAAAEPEKNAAKTNLRCWQYGRLLFEEVGLELASDQFNRLLTLQQGSQGKPRLHLVETPNATCLLKEYKP